MVLAQDEGFSFVTQSVVLVLRGAVRISLLPRAMKNGWSQARARAVRPPLNIRGQQVADGIVEVATTLLGRAEPAPTGARVGQDPIEMESTDELARKINCSTSAEKHPLNRPSPLPEPPHKRVRTDHTPIAGEPPLLHPVKVPSELEVLWQLGQGSQDWVHLSEGEKQLAIACAKAVLSDMMSHGTAPHSHEQVTRVSRLIVAAYRQVDFSEMLELDYTGIRQLSNICATEGLEPNFSLEPVLTSVADYQEVIQFSPLPSAQVARAALRWHSEEVRNADSRSQLLELMASDSGRAQLSWSQRCLCCGLLARSFCDACERSLCQPCEYALGGMCPQCWFRCHNVVLNIVEVGPIAEKAVLVDLITATWEAMRRTGNRTAAREHVHLLVGVASISPSVIAARLFPDGTPSELSAATNLASASMQSLLISMVQDTVAQGLP